MISVSKCAVPNPTAISSFISPFGLFSQANAQLNNESIFSSSSTIKKQYKRKCLKIKTKTQVLFPPKLKSMNVQENATTENTSGIPELPRQFRKIIIS